MRVQDLQAAMPGLPYNTAKLYLPFLELAMREGKITTKARAAAFLAQLGHESVSLQYMQEIASGAAYEGRRDLGNTQPGDGKRYKGRGPIQLTGRTNYRNAGKALGLPLESAPSMAARPSVGFRVAVWFWTTRGLNAYADTHQFGTITYRINGGYNGSNDRNARYARCLKLGARVLPYTPVKPPAHEAKMTDRIIYHRHGALKAKKGSALKVKHAGYREMWKARARAQMLRLQVDARTPGRGGWKKDGRGTRYQLLRNAVLGK